MVATIVAASAAGLALLVSVYCLLVPTRGAWEGLGDALLRLGLVGVLALICWVAATIGLWQGEQNKALLWALFALSLLPAIGFVVGASLLAYKAK